MKKCFSTVWEIDDNTKIVGMNILILNDEEENSVCSFNDINKIIAEKRSESDAFFNTFAPFFNHSLTTNIFNTLPQIFYVNITLQAMGGESRLLLIKTLFIISYRYNGRKLLQKYYANPSKCFRHFH